MDCFKTETGRTDPIAILIISLVLWTGFTQIYSQFHRESEEVKSTSGNASVETTTNGKKDESSLWRSIIAGRNPWIIVCALLGGSFMLLLCIVVGVDVGVEEKKQLNVMKGRRWRREEGREFIKFIVWLPYFTLWMVFVGACLGGGLGGAISFTINLF